MAFLLYDLNPDVLSVIFWLINNEFIHSNSFIPTLLINVDLNPLFSLQNLEPITTSAS
jgi:hypothetical protein